MAKSLFERLSEQVPYWTDGQGNGKKNQTLSRVREFVSYHKQEIAEARARGYSWKQIETVIRENYGDSESFRGIVWRRTYTLIEDCYHELQAKEKPNALSFNVLITR